MLGGSCGFHSPHIFFQIVHVYETNTVMSTMLALLDVSAFFRYKTNKHLKKIMKKHECIGRCTGHRQNQMTNCYISYLILYLLVSCTEHSSPCKIIFVKIIDPREVDK